LSGQATARAATIHLSELVGGGLYGPAGERLGAIRDLVVRLEGEEYPPVTGFVVTIAGRPSFVPASHADRVERGRLVLRSAVLDLRPFERRQGEVLLDEDVQDHQLVDVTGARVKRTNDIRLASGPRGLRVVGVETGARGFLRRLLPRRMAPRIGEGSALDWASVEPFVGHVPTVRLRVPHPKLARLHPAQIADLVETVSHREGAELLDAIEADEELEADVFEQLDDEHQQEFLAERDDRDVADTLARMESDDAADVIAALPEARRSRVIALLPAVQQRRVETLLGYAEGTAGSLMSLDHVTVGPHDTVDHALARVAAVTGPEEALAAVFVVDDTGVLVCGASLVALLRGARSGPVTAVAGVFDQRVAEADRLEDVARTMTDFDLVVVPVVDAEDHLLGVITVDDVLEAAVPREWRRQRRMLADAD
jgi:CBS domain-containing protein